MKLQQLRTINIERPGRGKRYSFLPVDRVDITGFYVSYAGSPLRPSLLDIREGDLVSWWDENTRYQATVDEVVTRSDTLHVAFRDVQVVASEYFM